MGDFTMVRPASTAGAAGACAAAPGCVPLAAAGSAALGDEAATGTAGTGIAGRGATAGATCTIGASWGVPPRLIWSFMSPRSNSNSAMSFSTKNSISSLISFWFMDSIRQGFPCNSRLNFDQFLGDRGKHLRPTTRDHHHIFYANAALAGHIDSRLNRDNHARLKPFILQFGKARRLVNLQSYSMSCGMGKVVLQLGLSKHLAGSLVHFGCRFARSYRGNACQLRFQHGFVPPALFSADTAHMHRARHVRTVATQYNTRIHHHESTPRYRLAGGASVRQGCPLARRYDSFERHAIGASLPCGILQFSSHFRLANSRANGLQHHLVNGCAKPNRIRDEPQLLAIFDHALAHDQPRGWFPFDLLVHQLPHLPGCSDRCVIGLEADHGSIQLAEELGSVVEQRALGNGHARALDLPARLLGVAAIGEEDATSGEKQQQPVAAGVTA